MIPNGKTMNWKGHTLSFESESDGCRGCFFANKDSCPDCDEGIWVEDNPSRYGTEGKSAEIKGKLPLRDEIAIFALNGMLAHSTRYKPREGNIDWHISIAREAYELADAMLKVRNNTTVLRLSTSEEEENEDGHTY